MAADLIVPSCGVLTACYLFFAPLPEVARQRKEGKVNIDCFPFPITLFQHTIFVILGCLLNDWFIAGCNAIGSVSTMYLLTTCLSEHPDKQMKRRVEVMMIAAITASFLLMMVSLTPRVLANDEDRILLVNGFGIVFCTGMYAAPCLEAIRAVVARDASRLSLPLAIASMINGTLWGVYGISKGIAAVGGPNAFGAFLAFVNFCIKLMFRSPASAAPNAASVEASVVGRSAVETLALDKVLDKAQDVTLYGIDQGLRLDLQEVATSVELAGDLRRMVTSSNQGVVFQVQKLADGMVALRTCDGYVLQVAFRDASCTAPSSKLARSTHCVWAMRTEQVGEEATFLPVPCGGQAIWQEYGKEDTVLLAGSGKKRFNNVIAFWNPLHQVFLRLNECGTVDCSSMWLATSDIPIPTGWTWERFVIFQAEPRIGSKTAAQRPRMATV